MNRRELYQLEQQIRAKSAMLNALLSFMELAVVALFTYMTISDKPVSGEYFAVASIMAVMMVTHMITVKNEEAKKKLIHKKRRRVIMSHSMPSKQGRSAA